MQCPDWLDEEARSLWSRLVPQLDQAGLLDRVDETGLEMLCQLYSAWKRATKELASEGLVLEDERGRTRLNPLARYADNCAKQIKSQLTQFGMTPKARGLKHAGGKDALDSFLERGVDEYRKPGAMGHAFSP